MPYRPPYYGTPYYDSMPYPADYYGHPYQDYYGNTPSYYGQHWQCTNSAFTDYVYNPKEARIRKAMREASRERALSVTPMSPRAVRRPSRVAAVPNGHAAWNFGNEDQLMMVEERRERIESEAGESRPMGRGGERGEWGGEAVEKGGVRSDLIELPLLDSDGMQPARRSISGAKKVKRRPTRITCAPNETRSVGEEPSSGFSRALSVLCRWRVGDLPRAPKVYNRSGGERTWLLELLERA
ncbi:hypothetical protein Trydic_g14505 [Trypoxylus dichotomus]